MGATTAVALGVGGVVGGGGSISTVGGNVGCGIGDGFGVLRAFEPKMPRAA